MEKQSSESKARNKPSSKAPPDEVAKLIKEFARSLEKLNEGKPISKEWRDYLYQELKTRKGREPKNEDRNVEIAYKILRKTTTVVNGEILESGTSVRQAVRDFLDENSMNGECPIDTENRISDIYRKYYIRAVSKLIGEFLDHEFKQELKDREARAKEFIEKFHPLKK